jgi:hypothetical protein
MARQIVRRHNPESDGGLWTGFRLFILWVCSQMHLPKGCLCPMTRLVGVHGLNSAQSNSALLSADAVLSNPRSLAARSQPHSETRNGVIEDD